MTMKDIKDSVEVWKNTAAGMRWYQETDRMGRQTGKIVKGNRTFTISPFDRQVNQDSVASAEQDHFRNGTYVLVKAAADTDLAEIESPDSKTDSEILSIVYELMAGNISIDKALYGVKSPIALGRIYERAVIEDASKSVVDELKRRRDAATKTEVRERAVVSAAPEKPEVKTPRGGVPEADTEPMIKTKPLKSE